MKAKYNNLLFFLILFFPCGCNQVIDSKTQTIEPVTDSMYREIFNFVAADECRFCNFMLDGSIGQHYSPIANSLASGTMDSLFSLQPTKVVFNQLIRINWMTSFNQEYDSLSVRKLDSLFTEQDIKFIYKQLKTINTFRIKNNWITNKIIVPTDSILVYLSDYLPNKGATVSELNTALRDPSFTRFAKSLEDKLDKYNHANTCSISMPLFSADKLTVIINKSIVGFHGETSVYRKINGKWNLVLTLRSYIV